MPRKVAASAALLIAALPSGALAGPAATAVVEKAIAVTQVYGEGQKIRAVALKINTPVSEKSLSIRDFSVDGRTITQAYTSRSTDPADRSPVGRYVILELSPADEGAALKQMRRPPAPANPGSGVPAENTVPLHFPEPIFRDASALVHLKASFKASNGRLIPAGASYTTTQVRDLVVEDFRQMTFKDPKTGDTLAYNLFLPKNYQPSKRYPLVLFMHDAASSGKNPLVTLKQGRGAISWASPADQARNPSIVVAPQYPDPVANDESETTSALDTTVDLIKDLESRYSIDSDRVYATGQSGGAMLTIAMNIKYPGLFAASYIVAGQWDAEKARSLQHERVWILVSQGDEKAFPGQNAITGLWEKDGAKVAHDVWDGRSNASQFDEEVARVVAQKRSLNYVTFTKGTVVLPGQPDNGGMNHVNTWRIAYDIPGIRDWLFAQKK